MNITFPFKKVVDAYLVGEGGHPAIAKRFGIPSDSTVVKWVRLYKEFGREGLLAKKNNKKYSTNLKIDALNYKLSTGDTFQSTALKYGITESSIIANWMWNKYGIEGISRQKGRPSILIKLIRKELRKR